jgi:hypothetical protein
MLCKINDVTYLSFFKPQIYNQRRRVQVDVGTTECPLILSLTQLFLLYPLHPPTSSFVMGNQESGRPASAAAKGDPKALSEPIALGLTTTIPKGEPSTVAHVVIVGYHNVNASLTVVL